MRGSKYNILTKMKENQYLITNLLTGAQAFLDENNYNEVKQILDDPSLYKSSELYDLMVSSGFIVPLNADELGLVKKAYWQTKFNLRQLNLTIIPTFNCNLGCESCYQKGFRQKWMSREVAERIYQLIEKQITQIDQLEVYWYGGEALLGQEIIADLGTRMYDLCQSKQVKFASRIATNGYLLNSDVLTLLKRVGVNQIETILAGTAKYHDALRYTRDNEGTFEQIIENIQHAREEFSVILAVNITTTNQHDIPDLLAFLKQNNLVDNIYLVFNQVTAYENTACMEMSLCDNIDNVYVVEMYKLALQLGLNICNMTRFGESCVYCSADHERSFVIDPDGSIYRYGECYTEETPEGYINEEGEIVFDR